jgi:hypothetical protein
MSLVVTLKQYSHVLIFKIEGEPDVTMSLTRARDNEPLAGVVTQQGYEPHIFSYSGRVKIPVLIEALKMYHALRLEVPSEGCQHDYEFAPEYYGSCPQPKRCTICGALDLNGYKGEII